MLSAPHPDITIGSCRGEREIENLFWGRGAAWCARVHERLQQRGRSVNKQPYEMVYSGLMYLQVKLLEGSICRGSCWLRSGGFSIRRSGIVENSICISAVDCHVNEMFKRICELTPSHAE